MMMILYDYLPSQNAWKVRQVLRHVGTPHRVEYVSIFEGQGQTPAFLAINPWGAVPAIRLDDGRVLSESNAIIWYLAHGSNLLPAAPFEAAKVMQWLSFEADYVQMSVGSLRYWALTGKLESRPEAIVSGKRATAERALSVLDTALGDRPFIAGDRYTIADISVFAYAHLAGDAGLTTTELRNFEAWVDRVRSQDGFLDETHPYSIDPHSTAELP